MTLYHYCSNETFAAVVSRRRIWLSSLRLSNDTLEGQLVSETMKRLGKAADLPPITNHQLAQSLLFYDALLDGLGFCLSANGDLLSQWRGYADDGNGVSIGFNPEYLRGLSRVSNTPSKDRQYGFSLHQVIYDPWAQEQLLRPPFDLMKEAINQGAFQKPERRALLDTRTDVEVAAEDEQITAAHNALRMKSLHVMPHIFQLKTIAFSEEVEWRLVSVWWRGVESCLFHGANNRLVPYREFELSALQQDAIGEVVLGPRNITPPEIVHSMLQLAGFGSAKVRRSEASYR